MWEWIAFTSDRLDAAAAEIYGEGSLLFALIDAGKLRRLVRAPGELTIRYDLYKMLIMGRTVILDAAFSALGDRTRRAILARLAKVEATVMELVKPFQMTQPAISQHLKVLDDAGLVVQRVDGTRRPRRLAKHGIDAMEQWSRCCGPRWQQTTTGSTAFSPRWITRRKGNRNQQRRWELKAIPALW